MLFHNYFGLSISTRVPMNGSLWVTLLSFERQTDQIKKVNESHLVRREDIQPRAYFYWIKPQTVLFKKYNY